MEKQKLAKSSQEMGILHSLLTQQSRDGGHSAVKKLSALSSQEMLSSQDMECTVVLLGDARVGKTALLKRFTDDLFQEVSWHIFSLYLYL